MVGFLFAFIFNDFHLEFVASDAINDPTEELYNLVNKLQVIKVKQKLGGYSLEHIF